MEKKQHNNYNTPYDDVFRTMLNNCPHLIIPVINEIFDVSYPVDADITQHVNEIFITFDEEQKKVVTDSVLSVCGHMYHLECQRRPDGTMLMRMFEYDSQVALRDGEVGSSTLTVTFPESAIMYLKSTKVYTPVSYFRIRRITQEHQRE